MSKKYINDDNQPGTSNNRYVCTTSTVRMQVGRKKYSFVDDSDSVEKPLKNDNISDDKNNDKNDYKSDLRANDEREKGNTFYKRKFYFEALLSYNKSLCYADSPQLRSLAYANRSAVFFELKSYSKCLQNIKWARDNEYPSDKIKKLDEREQNCRDLIDPNKDEFQDNPTLARWTGIHDFFKLSHPANEKIPFIVDCLELKRDDKYGRGIYATKDLKAGEIIAIDEIFIKLFDLNFSYRRCFTCMSTNMLSLIPCVYSSKFVFIDLKVSEVSQLLIRKNYLTIVFQTNVICYLVIFSYNDVLFSKMSERFLSYGSQTNVSKDFPNSEPYSV
jgi:hypothetical protein